MTQLARSIAQLSVMSLMKNITQQTTGPSTSCSSIHSMPPMHTSGREQSNSLSATFRTKAALVGCKIKEKEIPRASIDTATRRRIAAWPFSNTERGGGWGVGVGGDWIEFVRSLSF